jgi:DNA-binding NarL/FixJ family response regulator
MVLSDTDDLEVIGVVDRPDQAVERVEAQTIDIVIVDVDFEAMRGIKATCSIKDASADTKVLALTRSSDPGMVAEAVKAGADGFLSKDASGEVVVQTVQNVAEGRAVVDADNTLELFISGKDPREIADQELAVLQAISYGMSTRQTAELLGLSEETVPTHVEQIFGEFLGRDRFGWFGFSTPMRLMIFYFALIVVVVVAMGLYRSCNS